MLSGKMPDIPSGIKYALYLHFPFCSSKCTFCQQFSCAVTGNKHYKAYTDILCREIELYASRLCGAEIAGLYFGGGTPVLFDLEKVCGTIAGKLKLCSPFFFNVEATPYALTKEKLRVLKNMGVTRLCVGLQSLDPRVLKAINRPVSQITMFPEIYNEALQIGLDNICAELVCGLPEQTPESFIKDLEYLVSLHPAGIHIYRFMRSPATFLFRTAGPQTEKEMLATKNMYNAGFDILKKSGYKYYGDDFTADARHRNPQIHQQERYHVFSSLIGIGLSALGEIRLSSGVLKTANVRGWKKYSSMISGQKLPIDRACVLDTKDELIRARIIHMAIFGRLTRGELFDLVPDADSSLMGLCEQFNNEFQFLKTAGKIEIADDFSEIKWNTADLNWFKIFYSPAVLERCITAMKNKSFLSDFQHRFRLGIDC
ncbi:MAG: radical SAM protein [bacterium]